MRSASAQRSLGVVCVECESMDMGVKISTCTTTDSLGKMDVAKYKRMQHAASVIQVNFRTQLAVLVSCAEVAHSHRRITEVTWREGHINSSR